MCLLQFQDYWKNDSEWMHYAQDKKFWQSHSRTFMLNYAPTGAHHMFACGPQDWFSCSCDFVCLKAFQWGQLRHFKLGTMIRQHILVSAPLASSVWTLDINHNITPRKRSYAFTHGRGQPTRRWTQSTTSVLAASTWCDPISHILSHRFPPNSPRHQIQSMIKRSVRV